MNSTVCVKVLPSGQCNFSLSWLAPSLLGSYSHRLKHEESGVWAMGPNGEHPWKQPLLETTTLVPRIYLQAWPEISPVSWGHILVSRWQKKWKEVVRIDTSGWRTLFGCTEKVTQAVCPQNGPTEWDLKSPTFWTCWRQRCTLSAELSFRGKLTEVPKTVMHKEEQWSQVKLGQISVERWVTEQVFPKDKSFHTTSDN